MFYFKFLIFFTLTLILVVEARDGSKPVRGSGGKRFGKGGKGK